MREVNLFSSPAGRSSERLPDAPPAVPDAPPVFRLQDAPLVPESIDRAPENSPPLFAPNNQDNRKSPPNFGITGQQDNRKSPPPNFGITGQLFGQQPSSPPPRGGGETYQGRSSPPRGGGGETHGGRSSPPRGGGGENHLGPSPPRGGGRSPPRGGGGETYGGRSPPRGGGGETYGGRSPPRGGGGETGGGDSKAPLKSPPPKLGVAGRWESPRVTRKSHIWNEHGKRYREP